MQVFCIVFCIAKFKTNNPRLTLRLGFLLRLLGLIGGGDGLRGLRGLGEAMHVLRSHAEFVLAASLQSRHNV